MTKSQIQNKNVCKDKCVYTNKQGTNVIHNLMVYVSSNLGVKQLISGKEAIASPIACMTSAFANTRS